jgi:class 3 adenylate cyclase
MSEGVYAHCFSRRDVRVGALRADRRLAAILAADVVGYSRLMAADEKGTHARLKALSPDFPDESNM